MSNNGDFKQGTDAKVKAEGMKEGKVGWHGDESGELRLLAEQRGSGEAAGRGVHPRGPPAATAGLQRLPEPRGGGWDGQHPCSPEPPAATAGGTDRHGGTCGRKQRGEEQWLLSCSHLPDTHQGLPLLGSHCKLIGRGSRQLAGSSFLQSRAKHRREGLAVRASKPMTSSLLSFIHW